MLRLTTTEKSILRWLDTNSRLTFSEIGKKTRKSQQLVSYTVNSLLRKEIIKGFYSQIDSSKLGVLSFRVYFKISYVSDKEYKEFINHLLHNNHTSWMLACGGVYDLICTFSAKNPSQFNKILKAVISEFPKIVQDYTVLTTIVIRNYNREHLFGSSAGAEKIIRGDKEVEHVDKMDMKILSNLAQNARVSAVDMAKKLCSTPKTILTRIKRLEQKEIICGYRPILDLNKVNFLSNLMLIKYHNITVDMENRLINYLKMQPNVISVVKTLGEWDLEIELEVKNTETFRKIEREIRHKFFTLIQEIRSIPLYEVYKKNFFPHFLVEKY